MESKPYHSPEAIRNEIEKKRNSPCESAILRLLYISSKGWLPGGDTNFSGHLEAFDRAMLSADSEVERCQTLTYHTPNLAKQMMANGVGPAMKAFGNDKAEAITKQGAEVLCEYKTWLNACVGTSTKNGRLWAAYNANSQAGTMDEMQKELLAFSEAHRRCRFFGDATSKANAEEMLEDIKNTPR